jgi:hypothetical protein
MELLPADVLADVFGRLTPQSLAACRCVSKEWREFINGRGDLRLSLLPAKVAGMFVCLSATPGFEFFARPTAGPAIPRSLEYLPEPNHRVGRVLNHCNGVLVFFQGVVANPATRQWKRLPQPPPCPEISPWHFYEHLLFDPTVSRHYEVLLIPVVPTSSDRNPVFIPETAEWPPSQFTLRVFSSKAWRWEGRTFLREGMCAGTVADMRRLQEEIVDGWLGLAKMHQSVYWDGALYVSCGGNFFMRYVATGLFNEFFPF